MTTDNFIEYLDAARIEALRQRESEIFNLRFGLSQGKPHTLAEIGSRYKISRERVRQLVNRSQRRIVSKAKGQLRKGNVDLPCVELLLCVREIIKPEEPNSDQRFLIFFEERLSYLLPTRSLVQFIADLAYTRKDLASKYIPALTKLTLENTLEKLKNLKPLQIKNTLLLLSRAIWPKQVNRLTAEHVKRLERRRNVSYAGEGKAGCFFSNKLNRDVQYESNLELRFLKKIEACDNIITYQEQPLKIPYETEGKKSTYYPDILLIFNDYRCVIVEIKPVFQMALRENIAKWNALRRFCRKHGIGLLITDGTYSIEQIQKQKIKEEYVTDVLSFLEKGPIVWSQYKQIRDRHNPGRNDFVAMILKNGIYWELGPFRLSLQ